MRVLTSVKGQSSAEARAREAPPTMAASDAVKEGPAAANGGKDDNDDDASGGVLDVGFGLGFVRNATGLDFRDRKTAFMRSKRKKCIPAPKLNLCGCVLRLLFETQRACVYARPQPLILSTSHHTVPSTMLYFPQKYQFPQGIFLPTE